ncbi:hypothetical protein ACFLQN_02000 [Candidatus Aenigmatarchaeota archaeon]
MNEEKNPWIAAILNFLFIGTGYLYNGKRMLLGFLLFIVFIGIMFSTILPEVESSPEFLEFIFEYEGEVTVNDALSEQIINIQTGLGLLVILIPIGLAYDAYKEAEDINKIKKVKK